MNSISHHPSHSVSWHITHKQLLAKLAPSCRVGCGFVSKRKSGLSSLLPPPPHLAYRLSIYPPPPFDNGVLFAQPTCDLLACLIGRPGALGQDTSSIIIKPSGKLHSGLRDACFPFFSYPLPFPGFTSPLFLSCITQGCIL